MNAVFSAVAWISTMPPPSVNTKLASASALGVLVIVQVQHRRAADDAARNRGDLAGHRHGFQHVHLDQMSERQRQRDPGAGDRGATRAAIGVQHVAVERDRHLAHRRTVHHGAQRAADQTLDFLGSARLLAPSRFPVAAGVGGAGQHAVFRGDPAEAGVAQERRHPGLDAGGAQNLGVAHADQGGAFGVAGEACGDGDFAKGVGTRPEGRMIFGSLRTGMEALTWVPHLSPEGRTVDHVLSISSVRTPGASHKALRAQEPERDEPISRPGLAGPRPHLCALFVRRPVPVQRLAARHQPRPALTAAGLGYRVFAPTR